MKWSADEMQDENTWMSLKGSSISWKLHNGECAFFFFDNNHRKEPANGRLLIWSLKFKLMIIIDANSTCMNYIQTSQRNALQVEVCYNWRVALVTLKKSCFAIGNFSQNFFFIYHAKMQRHKRQQQHHDQTSNIRTIILMMPSEKQINMLDQSRMVVAKGNKDASLSLSLSLSLARYPLD